MSLLTYNPKISHLVMHVWTHGLLFLNQLGYKGLFLVSGCDDVFLLKSSYKIHMAEGTGDIMELYFENEK